MRHSLQKLNTRIMALAMAAMLLLCTVPTVSAAETSGSCGSNLTWTFSDGTLTISGSGEMTDYTEWSMAPWYSFREEILYLSLPEGLTSVGDMAFYDCVNLTAVSIPATVTDIGELAFCQCSSMTMLSLNSGLRSIGRSAFEQCSSLQDVRLPDSLTSIGNHAFYSCIELRYVTVPASVTDMGSGVFAYCENLIRADINASLDKLPTWTFYGCENLTEVSLTAETKDTEDYAFHGCERLSVVNFGGTNVDAEQLMQEIGNDVDGFDNYGSVTGDAPGNTGSTGSFQQGENGEHIIQNTTVTKTENTTVSSTTSSTTTESGTSTAVDISASVVTPEGWNEVLEEVQNAQDKLVGESSGTGTVNVTVYVTGETEVPEEVLTSLAGGNVILTVQTQSGSRFTVDCSTLTEDKIKDGVELSYTVTSLEEDVPEALNDVQVYRLIFSSSSTINAEVLIRLPVINARKNASLYQMVGAELTLLQTVVVDTEGYAHFYLASVDRKTDYYIGINVPSENTEEAIIPEDLHNDYGITDTSSGIEYVVTGRTSSWGMNINQVTWIMVGVLAAVVVIVGSVMFALNKRKLKMGYVPDLDDEDYE